MKRKKLFTLFTALLLAAVMSVSALSPAVANAAKTAPSKITPIAKKVTVYVGDEFELKVKTIPADVDDKTISWSIKKGKNVIAFSDNDVTGDDAEFIAKAKGTAKVMVKTTSSKKAVFTVKVKVKKTASQNKGKIQPKGRTSQEAYVDDSFDLSVKASKDVAKTDLQWSIADTSCVAFDEDDGIGTSVDLVALKEGTTTITCTNTATKEKVEYTITVLPDDDDDDDYDDIDDDDDDDYYDDDDDE